VKTFLPGATIGIIGGGQLGRMLVLAGRAMGYRFHVYDPAGSSPAGMVADVETNAAYSDAAALQAFAESVDVVTLEFENIPVAALEVIAAYAPVYPGSNVLHICQHRQREKAFLQSAGLPHVPFAYAADCDELVEGLAKIGYPCVIKTAAFGYDGKGQLKLDSAASAGDPKSLWERVGNPEKVVIERWIEHVGEFSVICARRSDGLAVTFPVGENEHRNHILHRTLVPARLESQQIVAAEALGKRVAEALDVVGLIAVELFLTRDGEWLINELAPRTHNSGHYTIEGCRTSQFSQQIRAICGLPLGSTELLKPTVMVNILGDVWREGNSPDWCELLSDPRVQLHLYDKGTARPGRKMGHFTLLGESVDELEVASDRLFSALRM
jgi:5-(carboxyamino)imidazole ribonucleotide synthase